MLKDHIINIISSYCDTSFNQNAVTLIPPPNSAHGDLACNVLLIAAKALGSKRQLAIEAIHTQLIENEDIAQTFRTLFNFMWDSI